MNTLYNLYLLVTKYRNDFRISQNKLRATEIFISNFDKMNKKKIY